MKVFLSVLGVLAAISLIYLVDQNFFEVTHNPERDCSGLEFVKQVGETQIEHYGNRLPPNSKKEFLVHLDGKKLSQGYMTSDQYSRRVSGTKMTDNAIILFGGSVLLGTGVNDDETIASELQKRVNEYSVYNYGSRATAPNNVYHYLHYNDLKSELPHKNFHFIYANSYVTAYSVDASPEYSGWLNMSPWYVLENGKLVHKGKMMDRPYHEKYMKLGSSGLYQASGSSGFLIEDNYKLLCELYKGLDRKLKEIYPGSRFTVMNFPLNDEPEQVEVIQECLEDAGIEFVDLSEKLSHMNEENDELVFPCLNHFTPKSSIEIAEELIRIFNLK
ncbi:MAG: hypothetical protein GY909_08760 [Oligoflexia bacterium]|nr:hypothetical protein [Oligoflexia bacterium]